jgi:hypothetical protein
MENIEEKFLRIDSFIYQDVRFVLMEEMEEPRYYFSILEAIAKGNSTLGKIINYTGLRRSLVGKYLRVLMDLDLIRREVPVTASVKTKTGIYSFKDNIFSFWFGFIHPYEDMLELGREEEVRYRITRNLNTHIGRVFEDVAEEFLRHIYKGKFSRLGRWWHRGEEIDLVVLDERKKEISFFEVKWGNFGKKEAERILRDLRQKAPHVKWHNQDRGEKYGIIAKRIAGKEKLREKGYYAYDLEDIEEMTINKLSKGR